MTLQIRSDGSNGDSNQLDSSHKRSIHVGSGIHVPQLHSCCQRPSPLLNQIPENDTSQSTLLKVICKERFSKKYRHPQLDASLTKARTKSEARSLIRCQRANIPCAKVLAYSRWPSGKHEDNSTASISAISSCLFLEYIDGCTVRQYFEKISEKASNNQAGGNDGSEARTKQPQCIDPTPDTSQAFYQGERVTTVINVQTLCVAKTVGSLIAKMHASGVIHGDLTTSNIMIRDPPCSDGGGCDTKLPWAPQLVLIDFGLSTSITPSNHNAKNAPSNKKTKTHKQQHNAEEKAVDLYVLERAFLSTHPDSKLLVDEVWKGYRSYFESLDSWGEDCASKSIESDTVPSTSSKQSVKEGTHSQVAKAVLNRLQQVRMRGRKRECFG